MSNLLLDSLEIQHFRAFQHLRIEKLGRVNLIVGKNSIGKTSLLEALFVYAHRFSAASLIEISMARDERTFAASDKDILNDERLAAFSNFFFGRTMIQDHSEMASIGPIGSKDATLLFAININTRINGDDSHLRLVTPGEYSLVENKLQVFNISFGGKGGLAYAINTDFTKPTTSLYSDITCFYITIFGLSWLQISDYWDRIALTPSEDLVTELLRIILPDIERLTLVGSKTNNLLRLPLVKLRTMDRPIRLRELGEGMIRVFGIALALVNAQNGLLLIDEFESGLHYSVQLDLWRLILQTARRLNVQVFATTHSWDCVEAFQQATQEDAETDGMLIRLGRKKGDVVATLFSEEELAIATREQIEVR